VEDALSRVREGIQDAASRLAAEGLSVPEIEGKLLRPLVALALVPSARRATLGAEFWNGALAIQMVHEASLLHDDILDRAPERRGSPTTYATGGAGEALVRGDLYLTGAYRAAAASHSGEFLAGFIEAVERTVAGEVLQNQRSGSALTREQYERIITGKSGELFGASALLAASLSDSEVVVELGRRVGALYQRVDDLLDYCVQTPQGKPALQDWRQKKWTFVLGLAGIDEWRLSETELLERLRACDEGASPLERALTELETEAESLGLAARTAAGDGLLDQLLSTWCACARSAVMRELKPLAEPSAPSFEVAISPESSGGQMRAIAPSAEQVSPSAEQYVVQAAQAVGPEGAWGGYFGRHSRSFRFASWLFPAQQRRDIAGVYAFCRFTDDLVDEGDAPVSEAMARVVVWSGLSAAAYAGHATGIPLLDTVMPRMARAGAPFHYVESLLDGVTMDLTPVRFETAAQLDRYTYRVASVVGGWVTEQFGIHSPELLDRAFSLGHAMQLTNILRDVGEDLDRGRLYLPLQLLRASGVDPDELILARRDGRIPAGWPELTESVMKVADRHYCRAFQALPNLPGWYARPVAVASQVYGGIHDEIRANGYDNLTRRAFTSLRSKLRLGASALIRLRRIRRDASAGLGVPKLLSSDG